MRPTANKLDFILLPFALLSSSCGSCKHTGRSGYEKMDTKRFPTPRSMQSASICLSVLVFCVSVSIVGLAGNAVYHAKHEERPVELTFKKGRFDQAWPPGRKFEYDQWTNRVASTPDLIVQLGDTYAILVAGAFGLAVSLASFALSVQKRSFTYNFTLTGRRVRTPQDEAATCSHLWPDVN